MTTPAATVWTAHTTPEGRPYWYNTQTRASVWSKPTELKSESERVRDACPWKQYTAPDGRAYWAHVETKQSQWTAPEEFNVMMERVRALEAEETAMKVKAESVQQQQQQQSIRDETASVAPSVEGTAKTPSVKGGTDMDARSAKEGGTVTSMAAADIWTSRTVLPVFATQEDAEKAFIEFLHEKRVNPDLPWEESIRVVIAHPMYKALHTVSERKEAFRKYCADYRKREHEDRHLRKARRREAFLDMLKGEERIGLVSRYVKAEMICGELPAWRDVRDERDRKAFFDEYISTLRKQDKDAEHARSKTVIDKLLALFQSTMEISERTRWRDLDTILEKMPAYVEDEEVRGAKAMDRLAAFEEHIKALEKVEGDRRLAERETRIRNERKKRDAFKDLLASLRSEGKITIFTRWMELYPLLASSPVYTDMLGQPGSTPMDLYRDAIVRVEDEVYPQRKLAQAILKDVGFAVQTDTTFEEFMDVLKKHERFENLKPANHYDVFLELQDRAVVKLKEEQLRAEKRKRKLTDDLKYLYRSSKDVTANSTFTDAKHLFAGRTAFEEADQALREEVFDYVVQRMRERVSEESGVRPVSASSSMDIDRVPSHGRDDDRHRERRAERSESRSRKRRDDHRAGRDDHRTDRDSYRGDRDRAHSHKKHKSSSSSSKKRSREDREEGEASSSGED